MTERSGVAGVVRTPNNQKWSVYINVDKKRYNLGTYRKLSQAVHARYKGEQALNKDLYLIPSPAERWLRKNNLI
jgi:poly-D-alanine transfer protein DltD